MLRRERLHAIQREEHLEIHRLLAPERAVVVERGDALLRRYELRAALSRSRLDEFYDGLLGRSIVPRRKRVSGLCGDRYENDHAGECNCREVWCASGFHCCGLLKLNRS